jgi:hypothetical protein
VMLATASASSDATPATKRSSPIATTKPRIDGNAAAGSAVTNAVPSLLHHPFVRRA